MSQSEDAGSATGAERDPEAVSTEAAGLLAERRQKLDRIRAAGIDPFPHGFEGREEIGTVLEAHSGLEAGEETDSIHRVAGRIIGRRGHGKAAFIDLRDSTGQIQLHAKADVLGEEAFGLLDNLDLGDFIGVTGRAIVTRRGQLSLEVSEWRVLAKSLRLFPASEIHVSRKPSFFASVKNVWILKPAG